jgi:hypothetical protein
MFMFFGLLFGPFVGLAVLDAGCELVGWWFATE